MTQVDHGKGDVMTTHEVHVLAIKSYEQGSELVNPGEGAFAGETVFVDRRVEQALATALGVLAVTLVFSDVGDDAVIEAHFASRACVKGAIGVEESSLKGETEAFHHLKGGL